MNSRKRHWMDFLYGYDFEVKYINGKENVVVDALSHRIHETLALTLSKVLRSFILQAFPTNTCY